MSPLEQAVIDAAKAWADADAAYGAAYDRARAEVGRERIFGTEVWERLVQGPVERRHALEDGLREAARALRKAKP